MGSAEGRPELRKGAVIEGSIPALKIGVPSGDRESDELIGLWEKEVDTRRPIAGGAPENRHVNSNSV